MKCQQIVIMNHKLTTIMAIERAGAPQWTQIPWNFFKQ